MLNYSNQIKQAGSNAIRIEVDCDGEPYALLWTFKNTATTKHPWHAKLATDMDSHKTFYPNEGGLKAAKAYLEALAAK